MNIRRHSFAGRKELHVERVDVAVRSCFGRPVDDHGRAEKAKSFGPATAAGLAIPSAAAAQAEFFQCFILRFLPQKG
jgi:hypothetical protein